MDGVNTYFTIKTITEYIIPAALVIILALFIIAALLLNKFVEIVVEKKKELLDKYGYKMSIINNYNGRIIHLVCYAKYDEDEDIMHYFRSKDLQEIKLSKLKKVLKSDDTESISAFKSSGGTIYPPKSYQLPRKGYL